MSPGVLSLLAGAALAGFAPRAAVHAPIAAVGANQSNNWGGYVQGLLEKGTAFHRISGEWVVPLATRRSDQGAGAQHSSTWIGIGGGCVDAACAVADSTLIQAGTEQDVDANGTPSYSAWWEAIPAPGVTLSLGVAPGQTVRVTIDETLPSLWTIVVSNLSTGLSSRVSIPYSSSYGSAEWIEETPITAGTDGVQIGPMPNLTPVRFRNLKVNGVPPRLLPREAIELVSGNQVIVEPSAPNAAADGFNACTYTTSCASP